MSEKNPNPPVSANGKPASPSAAVIRRMDAAEETAQERLIKKHVPAWVVSGAVHVAIIALLILVLGSRSTTAKQSEKVLDMTAGKTEDPQDEDLSNDDLGVDSRIEAAIPEIERQEQATVEFKVTDDQVGIPDVPNNDTVAYAPPGIAATEMTTPGAEGTTGLLTQGSGGANGRMAAYFNGRSGATKSRLVAEGGGNKDSERAVALGLAWLARHQKVKIHPTTRKKIGWWEYDQGKTEHVAAATGMALLPFLAAGITHKPPKDKTAVKDYSANVLAGLNYLTAMCPLSGAAPGRISTNMYEQAIATIPLCEAYGMTKDPALRPYAQAAINFIQRSQGPNGSWGYAANANGDTSIVGWQVQALAAAKLTKDLIVDDRVIKKAVKFLDHAAAGSRKSMYGYGDNAGAAPGTALTAVGLLSRYYIDAWGPSHPGMIDGVGGLVKHPPASPKNGKPAPVRDMYYYYYATQVVHFYEGEDWKNWNEGPKAADGTRKGGMRDWLVSTQIKSGDEGKNGSWDPEAGWFGSSCGRLGTTAMVLLTLEVYYRHLPLYKRAGNGDVQILEDK